MTSTTGSGSADAFADYYAEESLSQATIARFSSTKNAVQRVLRYAGFPDRELLVADIGCGAGTQAMLWARDGHHVSGIDINETLIGLARHRARDQRHGQAHRRSTGLAPDALGRFGMRLSILVAT